MPYNITIPEIYVKDLPLVVDTSIYASGDVMSVTQEITDFFPSAGGAVFITSLRVLDEAKQAGAFDILLFDTNIDVGALNGAYDITAVEARSIIGKISVAAADYTTWTNHSSAMLKMGDAGMLTNVIQAATGSTSLFVATISRDSKTYAAASNVKLKFGVSR